MAPPGRTSCQEVLCGGGTSKGGLNRNTDFRFVNARLGGSCPCGMHLPYPHGRSAFAASGVEASPGLGQIGNALSTSDAENGSSYAQRLHNADEALPASVPGGSIASVWP